MPSQYPLPFQNILEREKEPSRKPHHHLHRSYTAHPDISPPNRATTAPIADQHTHSHRHELRHFRVNHRHKRVPQSAVQPRYSGLPFEELTVKPSSRSHGTTPVGSAWGSRRGSLAVSGEGGEAKIKRAKDENNVREKEKAKRRNEELLSSLSALSSTSTSTTRRLDELYYSILEKLTSLQSAILSLQDLSSLTSNLHQDFQSQTEELETEVQAQVEAFGSFESQQSEIEGLEEKISKGREKVDGLSRRLERVRARVERWETREGEWQRKTSKRLRILWGVLASTVVLLLAVFISHHLPKRHIEFQIPREANTTQRIKEIADEDNDKMGGSTGR